MITPTVELLKEAIEDADELIEYVLSSSGDPNLPKWLIELKGKLAIAYGRLSSPVVQQEPKKHIPEDPYKKNSDFAEVKAYVDAGKLPPLSSVMTGIQYINKKGN
jgi:hypothetical protein